MGSITKLKVPFLALLIGFVVITFSVSSYAVDPSKTISTVSKAYSDDGDVIELDLFAPQFN